MPRTKQSITARQGKYNSETEAFERTIEYESQQQCSRAEFEVGLYMVNKQSKPLRTPETNSKPVTVDQKVLQILYNH